MSSAAFITLVSLAFATDEQLKESPVVIGEHGFRIHEVESSFQRGPTQIRVLVPEVIDPNRKYPAVYVLPVEAKNESRFGDGLLELKKQNLHNQFGFVAIAPTFSDLPWYADHPSDLQIRQETYFLNFVLPLVEKSYPVDARPAGRLLLGFSKSGYGAWSLLLRHPTLFGRAAAWDSPLMLDRPGKFGTAPIFGDQTNFDRYRITELLRASSPALRGEPRLVLTGYGNFRDDHVQLHALLDDLKISHKYRDGPHRKHDWHSGWLPEAVELLLGRQ
jgi:hypothetical protein